MGPRGRSWRILENPVSDARYARSVAGVLDELDFDVILGTDLNYLGMTQAADAFVGKLQSGDVAVFYYAGHGLELDDGLNYLAPVDFSATYDLAEAKFYSLSADLVQARMEEAGAGTRVVILDACRTNPFGPRLRTLTRSGLGLLSPQGGLVAYAAEPRKPAADDGLFARHLVAALQVPGLPASEVFTRVSEAIEEASGGTQVPVQQWAGAVGRFVFRPVVERPVVEPERKETVFRQSIAAELRSKAEEGDAEAQNKLGFMYEQGQGVRRNYAEAARLYRLAAAQGYAAAQNNLGFMYERGRRVRQDRAEAVRWYSMAAEQGNEAAQRNLDRLR